MKVLFTLLAVLGAIVAASLSVVYLFVLNTNLLTIAMYTVFASVILAVFAWLCGISED